MNASEDKPDLSRLHIEHSEEHASESSSRTSLTPLWIILAVLITALVTWLAARSSRTPQTSAAAPGSSVESSAPQSAPLTPRTLNATGYVVAQRRAAVSSKATGRLKELNVKEGDQLKANQIIGVLENEDLAQIVEREKANLEAIKTRIQFAEAELAVAELERDRRKKLLQEHAVSQSEVDAIEARYRRALADVAAQKANVAVGEAMLKEAQVNLEYTVIRAPFDGTVLTKNADIGEVVAPFGSSNNARAAVVTIADMSSLEVEADVSESNISKVVLGQRCKIVLDAFPDKAYAGEVDSIVPTVDRAKATVLVKIKFLDKDSSVIPEMSAKVEFDLEK